MGGVCHCPGENGAPALPVRYRVTQTGLTGADVVLGAIDGRKYRAVGSVGDKGIVHVAFLYGVCVSNTAEIVDQMFGKVKRE